MSKLNSDQLRKAVRQQLESLQAAGIQQLPKGRKPVGRKSAADSVPNASVAQASTPVARAPTSAKPAALIEAGDQPSTVVSHAPTLEILEQEVAGCTLCGELAATRTQTVFGVGDPHARLCMLGEAPGADEDRQGEPFVGRAGQLLNKILEACHLRREDVYILNILKCRPPGNRNPLPEEAGNCRRYLERQLELIQPEFICCMGAVAAQNLLSTTEAIGRMRGRVLTYREFKVVCTYHPAYLLRNPSAKKYCWDDMKLLMREMGTPVE
jgi:uracil-DNA glycosylase family 4